MDKRENIIKIASKYSNLVKSKIDLPANQFWLYGSFAKGNMRKDSDIDVALVVDNMDHDNYWSINKKLWQLTYDVDARIEPKIIIREDDCSGFLNEVISTGIELK